MKMDDRCAEMMDVVKFNYKSDEGVAPERFFLTRDAPRTGRTAFFFVPRLVHQISWERLGHYTMADTVMGAVSRSAVQFAGATYGRSGPLNGRTPWRVKMERAGFPAGPRTRRVP